MDKFITRLGVQILLAVAFTNSPLGAVPKDPGLYFDLGPRSSEELTSRAQKGVREAIRLRIEILSAQLSQSSSLHEDVKKELSNLVKTRQLNTLWVALAGGVVGAGLTWLGLQHSLPSLTAPNVVMYTAPTLGLSSFMIFASLSAAFANIRNSPPMVSAKMASDRRSEELVQAAEDIAEQMKAMAVPLSFWSVRRLQDFTVRFVALVGIEKLILNRPQYIEDRIKRAFQLAGLSTLADLAFMEDEAQAALTESELVGLNCIRRIQINALRAMESALDDPVPVRFRDRMSPQVSTRLCLQTLREFAGPLRPDAL